MPRPFPTAQELKTPPKRSLFERLRRWWAQLFQKKLEPARQNPPERPVIPPPAIVPVMAVNTQTGSQAQWLLYLRSRGAAPPSPMLEEVRSHLLAEIIQETQQAQTPGDTAFLQRLAKVLVTSDLQLPPFPSIARELDNLLFRGDPSALEVTAVVERDPALVREVWVRASSVSFRRPPSRLDEAIARVGFTDLWRVAMQMAMQSPVFRAGSYQIEAEAIHDHGVICADIAAQLSREPRGSAYIAGLLHDVGKLLIFRAAGSGRDAPSQTLVGRMIQNHHCSIGMLAARSWNLGPEVEFAIGFHHHPPVGMLNRPGPLGPTAIAEAAVHIAEAERGNRTGETFVSPPGFGDLPEEVREAVLAAHRLMDIREGKRTARVKSLS